MSKHPTAVICLSNVNGGMELSSVKLAQLLAEEIPIHFIAKSGSFIATECAQQLREQNINMATVTFKHFFSLRLIHSVRRYVKQHHIKNIIFLGASEMRSLYFAFKGLNINLIIRQGSTKSTPKKDLLHRMVYSGVTVFVGNCEYMKNNIQDIYPLSPSTKLLHIYSSVRLPELPARDSRSKRVELICVGRINPVKGQLISIKACKLLFENNIDFRLRLLGSFQDKTYYNQINTYLENCPYADKIEFLGHKPNVGDYLKESEVFLFPSRGEGMSNAIIEALGYGLIPLIYNNTSAPEFARLGFHIHLCTDQAQDEFARILLSVCENMDDERRLTDRNIRLARQVFSPEKEKSDYLALLV
jgi:glycosyltransferase involved in cell wall biosynthesis